MLLAVIGISHVSADGQTRRERERADNLVKEGKRPYDSKDYRTALSKYSEAAALNPKNGEAHFRKGLAHYYLGEYDQSAAAFEMAVNNGQKALEVYKVRWAAYEKAKRYDDALSDVNKVLAADPSNQDFHLAAADIYFNKGSYKEAASAYEKAIPKAANSADLYYRIAVAKSKVGDFEGQAAAAELAIARNTQFLAESWLLVGEARYAQKKIPEAIQAYSKALSTKPDNPESYRLLGELYRSQNDIPEAIKALEKAKSMNTLNGEVYMDLSLLYSMAEMSDQAVATGKSAATLLPNNALAHSRYCRALFDAKRYEMAIASCNTALKLAPDDGETLFYLGRANTELQTPAKKAEGEKYYQRALISLQKAAKEKPGDPDAQYMLGNVYADLQKNTEAIETYERVLALNPKFTRAHYNIGVILLNKKDKEGARARYDVLLTTDKTLADKLKKFIDML